MLKKQGYGTILCDYLPDNPGQHYTDRFYCVSTTDKEAMLEVAQKENVDGIVAYASDPAAPTAAYVAEKMRLPTSSYKLVELLTNKDKFRAFLAEHNLCTPKAKGYCSNEEAKKDIEGLRVPVLVKLLKYSYKEQWKDIIAICTIIFSDGSSCVLYQFRKVGCLDNSHNSNNRWDGVIRWNGIPV